MCKVKTAPFDLKKTEADIFLKASELFGKGQISGTEAVTLINYYFPCTVVHRRVVGTNSHR